MEPQRRPSWYLYVLVANRWFIVRVILLVMIPTVVITYLLPKKYTVETVIMPPEERSAPSLSIGGMGASEFAGFFSGGMGFSLPLMTTMSDVYREVLNSRSLIESVILRTSYLDSTELREKYEADEQLGLYWARKRFRKSYAAEVTPAGFIQIHMTTGDPYYSVRVSEAVVAVLDSMMTEVWTSRARQTREQLERRLSNSDSLLQAAADSLQAFEKRHGVVALEEEISAFVGNLASLKRQYIEYKSAAQALRAGYGSSTASLEMEHRAEALMEAIEMLEVGEVPPGYEDFASGVALNEIPDLEFEYASMRSDFEMAQRLNSSLKLSYEDALLQEEEPQKAVRVLDPPRHPGWKSKPKKLFIWIEVFLITLLALIFFLFLRERIRFFKRDNPESWSRWEGLLAEVKGDLKFWKRRRR
ncbi:hypothetical protein GF402_02850 [Candidatus Fermentibacteria bacterium]|nr:hypothetical protein [Candidatus Fermentibacteria bacterium]